MSFNPAARRWFHGQRGAVSAEFVALVVVVAAVIAAVVSVALPDRVDEGAQAATECLFTADVEGCALDGIGGAPPDGDDGPDYDDPEELEAALARLPDGTQIVDDATGDVLWESGHGLTGDPELDSILRTLAQVNDHISEELGQDSLDGNGLPLVVNYDASVPNAQWSSGTLETSYADGWALPHIIAHEFGHGLVHFLVDLHEKGHTTDEQRSMNEGFGDIISFNITGVTDRADPDTGDVYRSMRDPGAHDQPTHVDDFDLNSGCGLSPCIHANSSIVSHAYYLMVEGADGGDGLGLDTAEDIFYEALPRMDTDTDLVTYRDEMLEAAEGIHGSDSDEYRRVQAALDAVGLDDDFEGV